MNTTRSLHFRPQEHTTYQDIRVRESLQTPDPSCFYFLHKHQAVHTKWLPTVTATTEGTTNTRANGHLELNFQCAMHHLRLNRYTGAILHLSGQHRSTTVWKLSAKFKHSKRYPRRFCSHASQISPGHDPGESPTYIRRKARAIEHARAVNSSSVTQQASRICCCCTIRGPISLSRGSAMVPV